MITLATKSPDDTREVGSQLAQLVRPGDVLLLGGELGAGKTTFTQGFGRALGVAEHITSPTFIIVRSYEGSLRLNHIDLYRLDDLDEVVELGLPEIFDDRAVTLIEWGERAVPTMEPDFLELWLEFGDGEDDRRLQIRPVGAAWSARTSRLSAVLGRWAV